jgi:hypothetical protein
MGRASRVAAAPSFSGIETGMNRLIPRFAIAVAMVCVFHPATATPSARAPYGWTKTAVAPNATLATRVAPPRGFERVPAPDGSFAAWLRGLPMRAEGAPVLTHTGRPKWRQDVHAAVIDIDVGTRDLQQCADAIMRLRAEWLYSLGRDRDIAFNNTNGKRMRFTSAKRRDHAGFRKYMDLVFAYAGTYSLERELKPVAPEDMAIGDVFIRGGFPGHAVLVADMAENKETGERRFLLVQSYMPAQDIHVLKNPASNDGSPWYTAAIGEQLVTPEWTFPRTALRRWP